jgi:hypothetical protein
MSWLEKSKRKIIIYPEGNNIKTIPQNWLNKNNTLRAKVAQLQRLRKNPQWGVVDLGNDPHEMANDLEQNIKQIIKKKRDLEKRSSLCQKITRGVSRWLPCGNYTKVNHNERNTRKTRKVRKVRKTRKQMKN